MKGLTKAQLKKIVRKILHYLILCGLSLIFLMPFVWMLSSALKSEDQIFTFPPQWIPDPPRWENFIEGLRAIPFFLYLRNTLIITVLSTLGLVLSSAMAAYGFAKLRWPDRQWLFFLMLSTMMLPFQVTMIPVFVLFRYLGWVNTFLPLIVPAFFGNAFYIFLLRQFFLSIPNTTLDAARIDGCSEWRIFFQIVLPQARPALITVVIFSFLAGWNDFIGPLIYLSSEKLKTLALGLQSFQSVQGSSWALLMAVSALMTFPIIVLFFAAQRYFMKGLAMTGAKG